MGSCSRIFFWGGVAPALDEILGKEEELRENVWRKKSERLKKWRLWMKDTWKREPRKVYSWLKGGLSGEGVVNLHWQIKEPPKEVGTRVQRAEKEWGTLGNMTNLIRDKLRRMGHLTTSRWKS